MTTADHQIMSLAAQWRALEAESEDIYDDDGIHRLVTKQRVIELEMRALTPTTALAAIEQIDLFSEHDDVGILALGVLRGLLSAAA